MAGCVPGGSLAARGRDLPSRDARSRPRLGFWSSSFLPRPGLAAVLEIPAPSARMGWGGAGKALRFPGRGETAVLAERESPRSFFGPFPSIF